MDKTITLKDFDGCSDQNGANVRLCTHNTALHMNIYVRGHLYRETWLCASPDDAKALRDALIEAYPLEAQATKTKRRPKGAQEYKGNGKHEWEFVIDCDETETVTERLRVPGGWLYRDRTDDETGAATFVPVPDAVGYAV